MATKQAARAVSEVLTVGAQALRRGAQNGGRNLERRVPNVVTSGRADATKMGERALQKGTVVTEQEAANLAMRQSRQDVFQPQLQSGRFGEARVGVVGSEPTFSQEDLATAREAAGKLTSAVVTGATSLFGGATSIVRRAVGTVGSLFSGRRAFSTESSSESPFPVDGKGRQLFNADAYIALRKASLPPGAILERAATVVGVGPGGVIHQALIDGCREYEQMMRNMDQDPWTGFEEARVLAGRVVLVFAPDFTKYPVDPKVVGGLESGLVDVENGRFRTGMETRRGDRPVVYAVADMFLVTSDKDTSPMDFEHNRRLLDQMRKHSFEPQLKFNPFPEDVKVSSSPLITMLRHPGLDETDRNNVMKFDVAARWANCSIYNALKHLGTNGLQSGLKMVQSETTLLRQVFREQNVSVITRPPFVEGSRIIFETELHVDGAPLDKSAAVVRSEFVYSDESGDPETRARELSAFLEDKARNNMVHMSAGFR